MSRYKVAQDVEAEDKILGPFTFRQFIYLIIVAISIALAWGLAQVFILLAIIPLPIIIFFGALALPLRKDQPMEVYLAAVVAFYTKPRKRMWQPDGLQSLIEITAPQTVEIDRVKNLSQDETQRRLAYLANLADSHGWSIRHSNIPDNQSAMISDVYFEAQNSSDMFDDNATEVRAIDRRIEQSNQERRRAAIQRMQINPTALPAVVPSSDTGATPPQTQRPPAYSTSPSEPHPEPSSTPPQQSYNHNSLPPVAIPFEQYPAQPSPATTPVYAAPQPITPPQPSSTSTPPPGPSEPTVWRSTYVTGDPEPAPPQSDPLTIKDDNLQKLPSSLPAVIPHTPELPNALTQPYTPPKPEPTEAEVTAPTPTPTPTPTASRESSSPDASYTPYNDYHDYVATLLQGVDQQPPQTPPPVSSQPTMPTPTPSPVVYRQHAENDDKSIIDVDVKYNPYPSIHQSVIQPLDRAYYAKITPSREERVEQERHAQGTGANQPSPDIIRLANNSDLSVATIAKMANESRQAHEEQQSNDDEDDIVIPLR